MTPGRLGERFAELHERRAGYRMDGEPLELVALRATATVAVERPQPSGDDAAHGEPGSRRAWIGDGWAEVPVHDRAALAHSDRIDGPAIVELAGATCAIRPGWMATLDAGGTLVVEAGQ